MRFLKEEIARCEAIGVSTSWFCIRVLMSKLGMRLAWSRLLRELNEVLREDQKVHIALETMAGKGSEVGRTFDQLQYMIEHTKSSFFTGCLVWILVILHDAGYDLTHFDDYVERSLIRR